MCGRYAVTSDTPSMYGLFSIPEPDPESTDLDSSGDQAKPPRYNIAPTTDVPVVLTRVPKDSTLATADEPEGARRYRRLEEMRWGLVPSWAKDPSVSNRMFNARAESVPDKSAFKTAFERRRCLVPANGYFEWKKEGSGRTATKQPFYINPDDGSVMAFAGLWSFWRSPDGEPLRSCAIITTEAVGELVGIHDRMPLILPAADWDYWLDPEASPEDLRKLLEPPAESLIERLELRPVSNRVGNVKNDDAGLLERVSVSDSPAQSKTGDDEEEAGLFPV